MSHSVVGPKSVGLFACQYTCRGRAGDGFGVDKMIGGDRVQTGHEAHGGHVVQGQTRFQVKDGRETHSNMTCEVGQWTEG